MKKIQDYDKLRGGYYTPAPIANFIVRWAMRGPTNIVLEPSCGDGSFIRSISAYYKIRKKRFPKIVGVELDPAEAKKAERPGVTIVNSDFFSYYEKFIYQQMSFDAIVGNPPFIRSQNFDECYRKTLMNAIAKL